MKRNESKRIRHIESIKPNRKSTIPKIVRNSNPKINKALKQRVNYYKQIEDKDKQWGDANMSRHLINSVATSRINTLADTKNEILVSQKEATQAINQLNAEYNELSREFTKRNKLAKEDAKVKEKIKDLKEQEWEQERKLQGYMKRRKELGHLEEYVKSIDEGFEDQTLAEQIAKEKEAHLSHIRAQQRQMQLSQERAEQHAQKAKKLQDLIDLQEQESIQKMQLIRTKEDYERNKNFYSAKVRSEQRAQKLITYQNESTQHEKEANEKIEVIKAKEEYERKKKLNEEKDKLYMLRLETDNLKYNPNELQTAIYKRDLEKLKTEQTAVENERLRNSIVKEQNDKMLREMAEVKANQAKQLTAQQLEQIQLDLNANQENLRTLFFENTRNELLEHAHKTSMQIGHFKSANAALESDVLTQLNNVNEHIKYLEALIQNLQQQNTQFTSESHEARRSAMQTQVNLELQVQQLEEEKQRLIQMVGQMQNAFV